MPDSNNRGRRSLSNLLSILTVNLCSLLNGSLVNEEKFCTLYPIYKFVYLSRVFPWDFSTPRIKNLVNSQSLHRSTTTFYLLLLSQFAASLGFSFFDHLPCVCGKSLAGVLVGYITCWFNSIISQISDPSNLHLLFLINQCCFIWKFKSGPQNCHNNLPATVKHT